MSLLYTIVFASRCTSNHHRLAVDALRALRSPDAESWRTLLLHYHNEYLKGAKAPDDVFKDFKNHVLHVRDGEWGGAIEACEEWYRRTVRALKDKDWPQAAWCAGVMSHYYVDPIQPFHTHQTEEENVIHRAVEWSFSKSYATFQKIIEADLGGYPEISAPAGEKWLAEMVRTGANASNAHYETVIDHYNFAAGVKDPPAGLDQELKNVIAGLVAHAAAGLACILDRAFEEAAVKPPVINGALQACFLAMKAPIKAVLAKIADAGERKLVEAQYEEFRKTGKVRDTLSEDDKVVRELFAAEVLKTPLSSLNAKWPRETGVKAGQGAQARALPKKTPKKEIAAKPPKEAPTLLPAPVTMAAPAPVSAPEAKPEKPAKAPKADNAETPVALSLDNAYALDPESPVVDAPSIGPKTARRLEAVGVHTISDLLALPPATGAVLINQKHISAQLISDWQSQALLACTVPGLKSREAQALVACGVRDAQELIVREPAALAAAIGEWIGAPDAERAWGAAPAPTEADIAAWIARTKSAAKPPPQPKKKTAAA